MGRSIGLPTPVYVLKTLFSLSACQGRQEHKRTQHHIHAIVNRTQSSRGLTSHAMTQLLRQRNVILDILPTKYGRRGALVYSRLATKVRQFTRALFRTSCGLLLKLYSQTQQRATSTIGFTRPCLATIAPTTLDRRLSGEPTHAEGAVDEHSREPKSPAPSRVRLLRSGGMRHDLRQQDTPALQGFGQQSTHQCS